MDLRERFVSLRSSSLITQRKPKVVVRLAIIRVRIALCESADSRPQIALGYRKFTSPQMPASQRMVRPGIAGISLNSPEPIALRISRSMPILLEVRAYQVELVA